MELAFVYIIPEMATVAVVFSEENTAFDAIS
jgi:hypothetical protein